MAEIIIESEEHALHCLSLALSDKWKKDDTVRFVGWPKFEVAIMGEAFHGGSPTRVMLYFVEFQRLVNGLYSFQKYGEYKRLGKKDRRNVEFEVKLSEGRSTNFTTILDKILTIIFKETMKDMNAKQRIILILGVSIIFSGVLISYFHYDYLSELRRYDFEEKVLEFEQHKMELIKEAADQSDELKMAIEKLSKMGELLIMRLDHSEDILIDDQTKINAEHAKKIIEIIRKIRRNESRE